MKRSTGLPCRCVNAHVARRIVLTGGPGAGKTAVLELARRTFCEHVVTLPEAAGIVFGGGFPRLREPPAIRSSQRAIFHVERELERYADDVLVPAVTLCDRGTVDGSAYWPAGDESLFTSVGTTPEAENARYDAVIHVRTPKLNDGYNHSNPLRLESAREAHDIDERILAAWSTHPRRIVIESSHEFVAKAAKALDAIREWVPPCCRMADDATR